VSGTRFGVLRSIVRQTVLGMLRRLPTQWVMIACVAAMQSILAATLLLAFNLDRLSEQWERGGDVLVFLKPGTTQTEYERLSALVESWDGIDQLMLKTPYEAFKELESSLGAEFLGDSFEVEVLPATIEIEFEDQVSEDDQLQFRAKLLQRSEVDEVEAVIEGRGLLAKLYELRELIAFWRWIIGSWVGLSIMFVFSQFVRLNLHQRRREVEVLNSVGATRLFILSPLVIEGGLQAALGSITALWIVESILSSQKVGAEMMSELLLFSPEPLSFGLSLIFVGISTSLGAIASWRSATYFLSHQE
jgi:cell division transport system permease protein